MPEVRILSRTPFMDYTQPAGQRESVMILFQLADFRTGTVKLLKAQATPAAEDVAIRAAIAKMGKPAGEYRFV